MPTLKSKRTLLLLLVATLCTMGSHALAESQADKFYQQLVANGGRYQDETLQTYVTELGERLVAVSPMAGEKFTFTVVDSADINAYAMADNYVYINRGMLTFMRNEAQLVAVLAHEVAHITLDHVAGSRGAMLGAHLLSFVLGAIANSNDVYYAGVAYAESIRSGHGRENELDADSEGAKYMAAIGYPPREMINMLSLMKDYEQMLKNQARQRGISRPVYHGLFASHPRNDARLRNAVLPAGNSDSAVQFSSENTEQRYRLMTDGLIWGDNFVDKVAPPNRYSDLVERVRIDFPLEWQHAGTLQNGGVTAQPKGATETSQKSTSQPPASENEKLAPIIVESDQASLTLTAQTRTLQTPEEYLYNQLGLGQLQQGRAITPAKLSGYSGILFDAQGNPYQRIALVYHRYNAYLIVGEVAAELRNSEEFNAIDTLFMQSIETFRPISQREISGQKPHRIAYVKANSNSTIANIGAELGLSASEQDELRLINGLYPRGEPEAGDWLRIFHR